MNSTPRAPRSEGTWGVPTAGHRPRGSSNTTSLLVAQAAPKPHVCMGCRMGVTSRRGQASIRVPGTPETPGARGCRVYPGLVYASRAGGYPGVDTRDPCMPGLRGPLCDVRQIGTGPSVRSLQRRSTWPCMSRGPCGFKDQGHLTKSNLSFGALQSTLSGPGCGLRFYVACHWLVLKQ